MRIPYILTYRAMEANCVWSKALLLYPCLDDFDPVNTVAANVTDHIHLRAVCLT